MSFEAWKEGHVAASECQLPIFAPPPGLKREAVSSRLRQTLVHPDNRGVLVGLRYSADGQRLIAGHLRSGVVQVWDAASGRQLTRIETGPRNSSSGDYFQLSPDGQLLYVHYDNTRLRSVMANEKRLYHYDYSGSVRLWDVANGKPLHAFSPAPGRGITSMDLSPDGSTLLTFEGVSGDYEPNRPTKRFGILWDARTGQRRGMLPEKVSTQTAFAPDGKTILANAINIKFEMTAWLFLDAATGEVRRSIPVEQKHQIASSRVFSPDGKLVACQVSEKSANSWRRSLLKCWEVESGLEIASFESEKRGGFGRQLVFSPDGRTLAAWNAYQERRLYVIDVAKRKLLQRIPVESGRTWCDFAFSPDGKWIAAISQNTPENQSASLLKPEELPQPRILLIEAATGEVRETLIAPPAVAVSLCFSPDGKTLASGGDGRVLLWDMTTPPGTRSAAR